MQFSIPNLELLSLIDFLAPHLEEESSSWIFKNIEYSIKVNHKVQLSCSRLYRQVLLVVIFKCNGAADDAGIMSNSVYLYSACQSHVWLQDVDLLVFLNDAESFKPEPEKKKTKLISLSALLLNSFPTKEASKISCQFQFHVENKSLQGSMSCLLHCGCNRVVKSTKNSNLRCSQSDL